MREYPRYNHPADITEVNPNPDDFKASVKNGVVVDRAGQAYYNELHEISDVGHRLEDVFDDIEAEKSIAAYRKRLEEENKE